MFKKHSILWGTADSLFVPTAMKKSDLKPLITEAVDFSPQSFTAPDEHPVVFMFNKQKIRIILPFFILNYYEMIPLIPHVHFKNNPTKEFQMSPILYVSSRLIVIGARIFFHLNKVLGVMKLTTPMKNFPKVKSIKEDVFRKNFWNCKKTYSLDMTAIADGIEGLPSEFPNYLNIESWFNCDAIINTPDPDAKYWTAVYKMQTRKIMAANAKVDIKNLEGIKPQIIISESIKSNPLGSFWVNFEWDLAVPKKYKP